MSEMKREARLIIHQTTPLPGETRDNEKDFLKRLEESSGADLVAFPELALTGYSLKNQVQRHAVPLGHAGPLALPPETPPVAYGLPERGRDELVYNTAILQHRNRILGKHRKVYLPTYGLFDEGRYFARGQTTPPVVELPSGWSVGLLVCEDFWHPGLLYLVAMQGADLILVLSAAPGRGEPAREAESRSTGTLFSSPETWTLLARTAAIQYGVYLALANRAGVEEGLTFAGGSMVVSPSGQVLAEAPQGQGATLDLRLSRAELRRARAPFAHLRDEDPTYLARSLDKLLEGGGWGR